MVFAYSCTVGISIDPAMLVPQWQMKTPMRASCLVVLPAATGAAAWGFAACFLTSCFTGASFFASCFFVSVFLVVVFFFSAIIPTSQHLLQEWFAADPVQVKPEFLRAHSLSQSEQFCKVQHR